MSFFVMLSLNEIPHAISPTMQFMFGINLIIFIVEKFLFDGVFSFVSLDSIWLMEIPAAIDTMILFLSMNPLISSKTPSISCGFTQIKIISDFLTASALSFAIIILGFDFFNLVNFSLERFEAIIP